MSEKVKNKLTVRQKEEALWEEFLDAGLRYARGETEGDEASQLTKMANVMVKKAGVEAHKEGTLMAMLEMVHTDPAERAKAMAGIRPELKALTSK